MKTCPKCKKTKPLDEFSVSKSRKDGRASTCKLCKREMDRDYYGRNAEKFLERNKATIIANKVRIVEYLKKHPCVDCGEKDILVLEFDHREGNPKKRVTELVCQASTWNTILKEIEKCDVRCANCHARITRKRANDWRWQYLLDM